MCELLAANCALPTDIRFSLTGFCRRGGGSRHHADGFGAAFFDGPTARLYIDDKASVNSNVAAHLLANPILTQNAIAHIRKATRGKISMDNSHPFSREWQGRHWVFAHNGHLEKWKPKHKKWKYAPVGQTDSELAFCMLLSRLDDIFSGLKPSLESIFAEVCAIADDIGQHGTFNFVLSDGRCLIARCSTHLHHLTRQSPFGTARLLDVDACMDFSEINSASNKIALIATDPLTSGEPWVAMDPGEACLFVDGVIAKQRKRERA